MEGGTESQRRVFYTALYRCYERMINISEDGRYYSAFDHQVHEIRARFMSITGCGILSAHSSRCRRCSIPEMEADKIQSYVRMYQQSESCRLSRC